MIPSPPFSAVSFDIFSYYEETAEFLSEIIPPEAGLMEVMG